MIFLNPSKRSIYTQTGALSFQFDFILDNHSGYCGFGFIGDSIFKFKAISGRLLDPQDNFFAPYYKNTIFSVSGNISGGKYDYYLNGEPMGFGLMGGVDNINNVFVEPSGSIPDVNIFINGEKPIYTITDNIIYNTGAPILPITIENYSLPFEIFSGNFLGDISKFSLSGLNESFITNSYQFYFNQSGAGTVGMNDLELDLHTNFGIERIIISASGIQEKLPYYYIELVGPNTIQNETYSIYHCYFSDPTGNIQIIPSLTYVSGSGQFESSVVLSGSYNNIPVSGDIVRSGLLNSFIYVDGTGIGLTGEFHTGIISGFANKLQYATGQFIFPYEIISSGIGTGVNITGAATGIISGNVEVEILDGSGIYIYNNIVTGTPLEAYLSSPTGYTYATGGFLFNQFSNMKTGDIIFINDIPVMKGLHFENNVNFQNYLEANTDATSYTVNISGTVYTIIRAKVPGVSGNSVRIQAGLANQAQIDIINEDGYLVGGTDIGVGETVTPYSTFSGLLNMTFTGSGCYESISDGIITDTINVIDFSKNFSDVWDLKTGIDFNSMISYKNNGFISGDSFISPNPIISDNMSFYIRIDYNNPYPVGDIVLLSITGLNLNTGINQYITGEI